MKMVKYVKQRGWQKRMKGYGDTERIGKRRAMDSKYRQME
jgi:hypothetical protein